MVSWTQALILLGFVASQLLCFAAEGISVIDTADLNYASHVKVYLKNTLVNEHKVSVLDELKSNENNIEFNFGFIAYGNRDIKVKHRPSPKFSWVDGGVDKIRYYSLSPMDCMNQISYSVAGGKWQITKLSKPFAILPVWWETIYFQNSGCSFCHSHCWPHLLYFYQNELRDWVTKKTFGKRKTGFQESYMIISGLSWLT